MKRDIDSNLIGPAQASLFRTLEEIKTDVEELINLNDEVHAESLDVLVNEDGVVTLRGCVPDKEAFDAAEEAAQDVLGVTGVKNELEISG